MSGLYGWVNRDPEVDAGDRLPRMEKALSHYSWYSFASWTDPQGAYGLGQIGIRIFNARDWMISSPDGQVRVFFCGELFRTKALSNILKTVAYEAKSPALWALQLYQQLGEQGLSHLEGVYQLAILDQAASRLILSNDRFGLYPLLYYHVPDRFLFSPEIKAFTAAGIRLEIDTAAILQYTRFQFLIGDRTFFQNCHLLPAASILTLDLKTMRKKLATYWDTSHIAPLQPLPGYEDIVQQTGTLLRDAVQTRLQGDDRMGIYLSAGYDSRAILGLAGDQARSLTTISYGQANSRDAIYSAQLASRTGSRHHFFEFKGGNWVKENAAAHFRLTEGFHSWIHAHGISILPQVRALIDININGLCGEELNWDDPLIYSEENLSSYTARLFDLMRQKTTWPSLSEGDVLGLYRHTPLAGQEGSAFDCLSELVAQKSHFSPRQRSTHFSYEVDRRLFLYYTVFNRSHVEQRSPFLDYRYVEFVQSLPANLLFHRLLRRDVLRHFCPDLLAIPNDKDNLPIGRSEQARQVFGWIERGKKAIHRRIPSFFPPHTTLYADYETWLRGELREWGADFLISARVLDRGLFDPDFLRGMWDRFQRAGEVNIIGKIAPLMSLEMLLREFVDSPANSEQTE